ncbi:MAG: exodeoxyribonuclease VII small subunit [Clostridiales bacterium]|jgi:exodeoxyribonuclease VII small subunit|nr:exodeoxyribonuclease VII small subunit [Clostridiales bacterium]
MNRDLSFDQALDRLEEIIAVLEENEAPLEESIALYKEGMELSLYCSKSLGELEEEVSELQKNVENGYATVKFEYGDGADE